MRRSIFWLCALMAGGLPGCVSLSPPAIRWIDDPVVYQPTRFPDGVWSPPDLEHEDAFFAAADGTRLHGWFCRRENPRAVVLYLHGTAGNMTYCCERMRMLQHELGAAAMIFDYRGYGRSQGLPTEQGVLDDARAARRWLAQRTGVKEREIVLMGESLGGGVAVDLATRDGAAGLILESTFTSIPDVAAYQLPYTPVRFLMRNRMDSLSKIGDYHGPLLMAYGDADELIPREQTQRLFNAAHEPKKLLAIPGAGHEWSSTPEYVRELDQFLAAIETNRQAVGR